MTFNSVSFAYQDKSFEENLLHVESLLSKIEGDSLALLPELCFNGYSYERLDEVAELSLEAVEKIKQSGKSVGFTTTIKQGENFYNRFFLISESEVLHSQDKHKLFPLGDEHKFFTCGDVEGIKLFEFNGLKVGVLICFELRFTSLWERLKGADVILVPSYWGKLRETHFMTLLNALAMTNQCYVVASNAKDEAKGSGIISPFGEFLGEMGVEFSASEIKKMRSYIRLDSN